MHRVDFVSMAHSPVDFLPDISIQLEARKVRALCLSVTTSCPNGRADTPDKGSLPSGSPKVGHRHIQNVQKYSLISNHNHNLALHLSATVGKLFTHMPLSSSSIIWYQPMDGDALWLGR